MKDDWIYNLKDRMADYEENAPEGLWDDIDHVLTTAVEVGAPHNMLVVGFLRIATVAAAIALIVTAGYYIAGRHIHGEDAFGLPVLAISGGEAAGKGNVGNDMIMLPDNTGGAVASAPSVRLAVVMNRAEPGSLPERVADLGSVEQSAVESAVPEENTPAEDRRDDSDRADDLTRIARRMPDPVPASGFSRQAVKAARHSATGFGMFASNNISGTGLGSGEVADLANMPSDDLNGSANPVYEIFKNCARLSEEYTHHRPFRTGISVSYALNGRVSVSSGLLYARHTSDMEYSDRKYLCLGKRTLHYLGIPLSVNYTFYTWRKFDIYVSAGVAAEKCVAGNLERKYFDSDKFIESETEKMTERRWQWSVNAGAGVQLRLTPRVGIYAEPGVGYYIDNGSNMDTYFKEKPLNLNLNIGLRFTVP